MFWCASGENSDIVDGISNIIGSYPLFLSKSFQMSETSLTLSLILLTCCRLDLVRFLFVLSTLSWIQFEALDQLLPDTSSLSRATHGKAMHINTWERIYWICTKTTAVLLSAEPRNFLGNFVQMGVGQ